jgi:hypothetical protein
MAAFVTYPLLTVVALTLKVIEDDGGYVPPQSGELNTYHKVFQSLGETPKPALEVELWDRAEKVVAFFKSLYSTPQWNTLKDTKDAPAYVACYDLANAGEIIALTAPIAVSMCYLYSKLRHNVTTAAAGESVATRPNTFMGKINVRDRFFVKLVRVGDFKAGQGYCFEIHDRYSNKGFFYDRLERLEGQVYVGDCFAMYATPTRHAIADHGERHTIFRQVEIVENKGEGEAPLPYTDPLELDKTGGCFIRPSHL